MEKIKDVLSYLETRFPLSWQEDFDNCGVQCGDKEQEITGVLVCFEFSDKVLEEAISLKANLVIAHHPLIFGSGLKKVEPTDRVGRMVCKAIENHLVLYSMHTNVDSGIGGGNDAFAGKLKLHNVKVLDPKTDAAVDQSFFGSGADGSQVGLGRIGELPEPMAVSDFLNYVKECLDIRILKYSGPADKPVRKVALCGGGGASFIRKAMDSGADAYVSGDMKYHDFFIPDNQMLLLDVGHFEGEHFIKEILYAELKEKFTKFAIRFSTLDKLEIYYA